MRTFIIERQIPGASQLTEADLRGVAAASNKAIADLDQPVHLAAQLRRGRPLLLRAPRGERRDRSASTPSSAVSPSSA